MKKSIFSEDLKILNQSIRSMVYTDSLNKDLDISTCDLSFNILRHTEKARDFKVQLFLQMETFKIFVEGHYQVDKNIPEDNINLIIEKGGLTTLIPFLRYSILNATSATKDGPINLPLINLHNLINNQMEKNKVSKNEKGTNTKKKNR